MAPHAAGQRPALANGCAWSDKSRMATTEILDAMPETWDLERPPWVARFALRSPQQGK